MCRIGFLSAIALLLSCMALTSWTARADRPVGVACGTGCWEDDFGRVTVGTPKVWTFDRIYSTIDGLLRDVDAVQVNMTQLDPNAPNQTVLDFISSSLGIAANFNQATSRTNQLTEQAISPQMSAYSSNMSLTTALNQARESLVRQIIQTQAHQSSLNPADQTSIATDADTIASLTTQLRNLNTTITGATGTTGASGATGTPSISPTNPLGPTGPVGTSGLIGNTGAVAPTGTAMSTSDLKSLILGLTGSTGTTGSAGLPPATLPSTKRLDNFITLLHERISRELSITFDDAARKDHELFLAQFDVSVYPYKDSKDRILQVRFYNSNGANGETLLAYDLYPAMSAYNITQFYGKSTGTGISAGAAFLFGFGASVEYRRQRDYARSSITQSVYTSGFGAGTDSFGWYFGSAPEEHFLTPGSKTVYAVISVPKGLKGPVKLAADVRWIERKTTFRPNSSGTAVVAVPLILNLPDPTLELDGVSYQTRYASLTPTQLANESKDDDAARADTASVQLDFKDTVDPNLVVTVNGVIVPRLRDARGRATTTKSATLGTDAGSPNGSTFGLLETDNKNDAYWMALGPRRISIRVTRALAGREKFPVIRLLQGGKSATPVDLALLTRKGVGSISINGVSFNSGTRPFPATGFAPLFSSAATVPVHVLRTEVDLRIQRDADTTVAPADEETRVYIKAAGEYVALECHQDGDLICRLPPRFLSTAAAASAVAPVDGDHMIDKIDTVWVERGVKSSLSGFAGHVDRAEIESAPFTPVRFDPSADVSQTRDTDGALTGWIVKLSTHNLEPEDEVGGWAGTSGSAIQKVTLPESFGNGDNPTTSSTGATSPLPQYRLVIPPLSKKPRGLEVWIPVARAGELLKAHLFITRNISVGDRPAEKRVAGELPDLFSMVLPLVSGDGITDDANNLLVPGTYLDNMSEIRISGCTSDIAAKQPCGLLKARITGSWLVLSADAKLVPGTYPLQFRIGPNLWIDRVVHGSRAGIAQPNLGSLLYHQPKSPKVEEKPSASVPKPAGGKGPALPAGAPPGGSGTSQTASPVNDQKEKDTEKPWLKFFPQSGTFDSIVSPVSPAERMRQANAKP